MARLDTRHWLVDSGDTWASVALAVGVTRNALVVANGEATANTPVAVVGRVLHLPLVGP